MRGIGISNLLNEPNVAPRTGKLAGLGSVAVRWLRSDR